MSYNTRMRTRSGKCVRGKGRSIAESRAQRRLEPRAEGGGGWGLVRYPRAHCVLQPAAAKEFKVPVGGEVTSRVRSASGDGRSLCVRCSGSRRACAAETAEGFEAGSTPCPCREPRPRGLVSSGLVRALGGRLRETDADAAGVEARPGVPAAEGPPQPPRAPGPSPGRGGRRAAGE